MVTNLKTLISLCDVELRSREYSTSHHKKIKTKWDNLSTWFMARGYQEFSEAIGFQYCDELCGAHILTPNMSRDEHEHVRAIRMLTSYQRDGDFEFRTPKVERLFEGTLGCDINHYLSDLRHVQHLAESTISNKELYLYAFNCYLQDRGLCLDELSIDIVLDFMNSMNYSLASRHNCGSTLRLYLQHAFDQGISEHDTSIFILPDNYNRHCKIPTTYEEDEIRRVIAAVGRASAIGKRDYLVLLLAAEYGWRSGDITRFRFSHIDWEKNTIRFSQQKTDAPVEYPLLASVGNAIIDYLKHGRPETDAEEIIVAAESSKRGKPLASPTIHSIVSKYMSKANIQNWNRKKHGAHALRHSLATNMLKRNVSLPLIGTVLGHQNTDVTKGYLKIDTDKLRLCALPVPTLCSQYYVTRSDAQ